MAKTYLAIALTLSLFAAGVSAEPTDAELQKFQELLQQVQADPGGSTETQVLALLQDGRKLGRAYTASLALKGYLAQNFNPSADLMLAAAQNAVDAGDLRNAVARYKSYLSSADDNRDAALAAARLLDILVNMTRQRDDAFQFMTQSGDRYRKATEAKQFDQWYLHEARERKEWAAMADRLALILSEKMPLEMEQVAYWDDIEWLMMEITEARSEHRKALPGLRRILEHYRGDDQTKKKYALIVAYVDFKSDIQGKEESAIARRFELVGRAAVDYVKADPKAETVRQIMTVFAGGYHNQGDWFDDRWEDGEFDQAKEAKQATFARMFEQLSDKEKKRVFSIEINGDKRASKFADWRQIAPKHPKLFRNDLDVRHLWFNYRKLTPGEAKKLEKILENTPSDSAALVQALAQGNDFAKVARHFVEKNSWHLKYDGYDWWLDRALWPEFEDMYKDDDGARKTRYRGLVASGQIVAEAPPAIFQPRFIRGYLNSVWRLADRDSKADIIKHLEKLEWVPWDERDRREALNDTYNQFKRWARDVRRDLERKKNNVTQKTVDQIGPIEAAFQKVFKSKGDPSKASNDMAKLMAQLVIAQRDQDSKAWNEAARKLYQKVRRYDEQRAAWGEGAFRYLLEQHKDIDELDFHVEVVRDQLQDYQPDGENWRIRWALDETYKGRWGYDYWRTNRDGREGSLKFADAYAEALTQQIKKGQFWSELFWRFRGARDGNGWDEKKRHSDLAELIIKERVFEKHDYAMADSPVVSYMAMIDWDFKALDSKYPHESYFDDWFIEESKKRNHLNWRYWEFGRDREGKVVDAAAEILAGYDRIPLGYHGEDHAYSRSHFWDWFGKALNASDALRDKMLAAAVKQYDKTRWDAAAMGRYWFTTQADVGDAAGRKEYFQKLAGYVAKLRNTPLRHPLPNMAQLERLDADNLTKAELDTLLSIFPYGSVSHYSRDRHFETMGRLIHRAAVAQSRQPALYDALPNLWRIARETHNDGYMNDLASMASDMIESGHFDVAAVSATYGMDSLAMDLPNDARSTLVAVKSKALSNVGGVIPVPRSDPRYPVFAAQAAYLTGKTETAWEQYLPNRDKVLTMYKDLDPGFVIWLIDKNTETGNFDAAETLARELIVWTEKAADTFQTETRARLELAYADIAKSRPGEFPRAKALYRRIADNRAYEGTRSAIDAELRLADVDRQMRQYDSALSTLEELASRRDPYVKAEAYYLMAQTHFDREDYSEAKEALDELDRVAPHHPLGKILLGKVKIALRKYDDAREVSVTPSVDKKFIVPGKVLRVTLEDRSLSVVGRATELPIRAWTDSGDEEVFSLFPFGDSKTKFRGELPTALAPTKKGDRTLQLLGTDKVHYDFTEQFKRDNAIEETVTHTLTVISDSKLLVSSGKILTEEEQAQRQLEKVIRRQLGTTEEEAQRVALSTVRPRDQVKPGNPINIRVVDLDRSATPERDKLAVRITADSGDIVNEFLLEETDTHSGVFEGALPTATGIALAYASGTQEGSDPNFAISAKEYPAWVGLPDNRRPKSFSVDLKDNVDLGDAVMKVIAGVPGRKLKNFLVQTSLNGRDFTTVGSWPKKFEPWTGEPQLTLVSSTDSRAPRNMTDLEQYIEYGYLQTKGEDIRRVDVKVKTIDADWGRENAAGKRKELRLFDGGVRSVVARYRLAFEQKEREFRTFELQTKAKNPDNVKFLLLVNGEPGETDTFVQRKIVPGVHTIEVLIFNEKRNEIEFTLMKDGPDGAMVPCEPEMFTGAAIREAIHTMPATVQANEDDSRFAIAFPRKANARVIRLMMLDFETDAPAIEKIHLTAGDGEKILPTAEDFMDLRRNKQLEIVPGDRIRVTYDDPSVVTENTNLHEAFLTATYSNAEISAAFVRWDVGKNGDRNARYVPMRRFEVGDAVKVFVRDPDMDTSDEPDTVTFTVESTGGEKVTLKALETDPHSGVFLGDVFPVVKKSQQSNELVTGEQHDIILKYHDKENTDPGIAWMREVRVDQAMYVDPEMAVFDVKSEPLDAETLEQLQAEAAEAKAEGIATEAESVPVTRTLVASIPEDPETKPATLVEGPLLVEVTWPTVALASDSSVKIFAQTSAGREVGGANPDAEFDLTVPGTIELKSTPSTAAATTAPQGYLGITVERPRSTGDPLDMGQFGFNVPLKLGTVPATTLVAEAGAPEMLDPDAPKMLSVQGGDTVYVGFRYENEAGEVKWMTREVGLYGDSFFDVMDRRYQEALTGVYVGESAYLRVIDKTRDQTGEKDTVTVKVTTQSGHTQDVELMETFSHSGEFKSIIKLSHIEETTGSVQNVLPVVYGDKVTLTYTATSGAELTRQFDVFKGSDGDVLPFTKRFKDPKIAVKTQFMLAEAYFEQAKKHRALAAESKAAGKDEQAADLTALSRREMEQGRRLLYEAIRDHPDTDARVQAEYLLANLDLEYGNESTNADVKRERYMDALSRFTEIVASYPDSPYAPKAQYKKALVFEKMGEIDKACEEYVKLSYRYPENELVAETIARLGHYFLTKGKELREEMEAAEDAVAAEKVRQQSVDMFTTAAEVFSRLGDRFPNHNLAGKTAVLSAQCFMQAQKNREAARQFEKVIADTELEPDLKAEAMYWAGENFLRMAEAGVGEFGEEKVSPMVLAYRKFKQLDWDYPTTTWARYARGRLADEEALAEIDERGGK